MKQMEWVMKFKWLDSLIHPRRWKETTQLKFLFTPQKGTLTHRFAKYCNMAKCPRCGGLYDPAKMTVVFSLCLVLLCSHGKATMVGATMGRINETSISIINATTTTTTTTTIPTAPAPFSKNATIIQSAQRTLECMTLVELPRAFWN